MLAIARALMGLGSEGPRLLLLDEPSLGLAPVLVDELLAKLRAVAGTGTAILLAEQSPGAALRLADRAIVLAQGGIAAAGDATAMRRNPELTRLVMGLGR
jgi:branched-chain amino acid transport system ATP-binding protein